MIKVNIYDCKTNLSKYLSMLEEGKEQEIVICNRGVPCFKITPIKKEKKKIKYGTALKYLNGREPEGDPFSPEIEQEITDLMLKGMDEEW